LKKHRVTFLPDGISLEVPDGTTIAEAAKLAEVHINNLCGGQGVCGECRVIVLRGQAEADEASAAFFSQEELDKGFLLACQTEIHDGLEIMIPPESRLEEVKIITREASEISGRGELRPLARKFYLELPPPTIEDNISDSERISRELRKKLGWHSYEIALSCLQRLSLTLRDNGWNVTATVVNKGKNYRIVKVEPGDSTSRNYGVAIDVGTTTVVAQMIFACSKEGGLHPLHEAIIKNINDLIGKLTEEKDIPREEINAIVAAGNTTMSHFLLGLIPCSIRVEPYVPAADVYPQILAREIGIHIDPSGILETIPSVASYVGGDIVSGVMACGIPDRPEVRGLIDIGTNGEIAIGNNEWLVCCSASAGPAFEGGGTRCGMRATRGAIEKVEISDGHLHYQTIGNARPRGICGSGLIDCIYELVRNEIISADGKFSRDRTDPRLTYQDDVPQYTIASGDETEDGRPIVITEPDIGNLIKSKGAVFAAIKSLYVAGGFGSYLDIDKAVSIGLLPDIPREKIRFVGNSSLAGARLCLLSESALEKCLNISRSMTNIELSIYQPFMNEYIAALFLPHTDRKLFPSVRY